MKDNFYTLCEQSALGNQWVTKEKSFELLESIRANYNLSYLSANVVANREIALDELPAFLNPSLKHAWINPAILPDMQPALELMQKIIEKNGVIGILGDYDVDGISASALLKEVFDGLKIKTHVWLPKREDGYGPSAKAFEFFQENPVNVLILVDCGSSAHDFARIYTKDMIIIDHHTMDEIVANKIVINPHRKDVNPLQQCEFQKMCATSLAFLFAHQVFDRINLDLKLRQEILTNLLDLVALATICDVMEINNLNRAFIKKGIEVIEKQERVGLRFLIQRCELKFPLSGTDIAFYIGPRINAAGRIDDPMLAFNLLTTKNEQEALQYANKLEELNNSRKTIQQEAYEEAANLADPSANIICIASLKWHAGIVGIIAAKIQEQFKKPAIVGAIQQTLLASFNQPEISKKPADNQQIGLAFEETETSSSFSIEDFSNGFIVKASARSQNAHIGHIIQKAVLEKIITSGGGHAAAGGLSATLQEWENFKHWVQDNVILNDEKQTIIVDAIIDLGQIDDDFKLFAPHGQGNQEITILTQNIKILKVAKYEKSTRISASHNYKTYTFFVQNHRASLIEALKRAYESNSFCNIVFKLNSKGYHSIEDLTFEFQN